MNVISDTLRTLVWFFLCAFLVLGMLFFAVFYAGVSFINKKLAWKDISITPAKFAK